MKRPACASKWDGLVLTTILYMFLKSCQHSSPKTTTKEKIQLTLFTLNSNSTTLNHVIEQFKLFTWKFEWKYKVNKLCVTLHFVAFIQQPFFKMRSLRECHFGYHPQFWQLRSQKMFYILDNTMGLKLGGFRKSYLIKIICL